MINMEENNDALDDLREHNLFINYVLSDDFKNKWKEIIKKET